VATHFRLWLFAILFTVAAAGVAPASEVVIGSGEYPPYTSEKTDDNGCVLTIVKSAYEAEGWTVDLRFMPWPRNLATLSRGEIDASAFWVDQPDRREAYIFPENPVASEIYRFVFPKESVIKWKTYEDLRGKTIITNSSYTYSDEFYQALDEFNIKNVAVAAEDQNLRMILRGRGDFTIVNEKVFEKYIIKLSDAERSRLYLDPKPAFAVNSFLVFTRSDSEKSLKLAEVFDRGYEKIQQRQDLQEPFKTCGL
jgi:polar amino acid transport system substrate-binding protein